MICSTRNIAYHKHHRRKRRWSNQLSGWSNDKIATSSMEPPHVKLPPGTACHLKPLAMIISLIISLVLFTSDQSTTLAQQIIQAQSSNMHNLLPGHNMDNLRVNELEPVGIIVHTLKVSDKTREMGNITFALAHLHSDEYFSVDGSTGEVRLIKRLDRELRPTIRTVVSVLNNSETVIESKQRTILVEDADDSWPMFMPHRNSLVNDPDRGHYVFQAEVSERALPNSTVLAELIVTDADEGKNAAIVFECSQRQSSARACEMFSITARELRTGRYSVTIRTRQFLDYESDQSFRFCLIARGVEPAPVRSIQRSTPGRGFLEAEAVIKINVLNVQDEGPQFVNAPYSLSMSENVEPGSRQLKLIVQDGDLAPKRDLNVVVAEGPFKKYFTVTRDAEASKVWYLETNTTLDREEPQISKSNNLFTIDLVAMELDAYGVPVAKESELLAAVTGANYSKATLKRESVTILVLDQPDSLPVFVRTSSGKPITQILSVNISEALAQGVAIPNLDISLVDLDQSSNSQLHLALIDSPIGPRASEVFALETQQVHGRAEVILNVINSSLLDYEEPSRRIYRMQLEASKQFDTRQLVQRLDLQLNLMDANDNWPAFERSQYSVSVPEGSPPGHLVATIKASDRDSGSFGQVSHYLIGHGASKFKVVSNEGKILVADCGVNQCLDFEIQSSYLLTYGARDGGGQTRNVSLIINIEDVNDHAPKFSESIYKRELISDNLSSKQNYISPQLIVKARDEDGGQSSQSGGNITYHIRSSNLTGLDVVPNSGLVYLAQPLDLDDLIAESQQNHNDPNALIANRRKIVFEAEVVAQDSGSPPLNTTATILLVVRGNRDGAPEFKQELYSAYVPESQPAMKPFFKLQAIDPDDRDSQLRYSLGYDLNDLISIDEQTGQLAFKTNVDYDDFKGKPYNVTVYATDNSRPYPLRASTVVSILIQDVNNRAPKFLEHDYKASLVQGRTKVGDVVVRLTAIDLDLNANLNYSLLIENNTFMVHDRNGQQFSLDDLANSTSGYLSRMPLGERFKMIDRFRRLLAINSKTGAIELRAEPDYSFASSFTFRARVVDLNQEIYTKSGETQEDTVECHFFLQTQIDRRPLFTPPWTVDQRQYNISILEELPVGTPIFSLLARDPHGQQNVEHYEKVFESDPRNYFRVDRSGQILINKRLDYEELAQSKTLQLEVKAINGEGLFSVAIINVHLMDLNDNAPQFRNQTYRASISEAQQGEQPIVTLSAEDRDSGNFGQVYYSLSGISRDLFQIHPRKGVVSLRRGLKLDRDTEASHHLIAVASDCNETFPSNQDYPLQLLTTAASSSCKRTSVPVEITLLDENDNDPVFVSLNRRSEYEATVSETISLNSVITQVVAKDLDEGPNGQVGYEIVRSEDQRFSRLFKIDSEGYISANGSLSGLGRSPPYRLTIRAFDMGPKQSRQSFATLALTISDVVQNDGVPKFVRPRPDEVVTLPESAGPSTFVYQAQAVDPDEDANGKLMYKFLQPSDTFEIDPFEGVIKTQHRAGFYLDREIVPNYTLIIVAQDLGNPPKQAHQVLTIRIGDVNDNDPYFERGLDDPPLVLQIDEEVPTNTLIGTIRAIDKDVGQNALIGYEIIEGNSQNLFRLDWEPQANSEQGPTMGNNPCRIYSMGRLDRDSRESYTLTIRASSMSRMRNHLLNLRDPLGGRNPFNQYNASDLTKIRVIIKLTDINDNRPVFVQPNAKSVVDSSAEIYSQLMVVKAVDVDSSSSEMHYSILEAIYYSDSKFNRLEDKTTGFNRQVADRSNSLDPSSPISMKDIFDIHPQTGILRNSVSLRRFTDGYFEVFIKADSGQQQVDQASLSTRQIQDNQQMAGQSRSDAKCETNNSASNSSSAFSLPPSVETAENCFVSITKAIIFVTHPRDTFRFVFNKTKLNDRLEEFKRSMQHALEDMMFDSARVQASTIDQSDLQNNQPTSKAEKVYLNTFNTDFYERDDGSLDFSTITTCSQLVKFDDRAGSHPTNRQYQDQNTLVPNQVVSYDEVVSLLKTLNTTASPPGQPAPRQQQPAAQAQQLKPSLFSQYGLVRIERCLPDKILYRMTISERLALYLAVMIALFGILLTFIVSRMRKNYERNLKILQRSKYQYMGSPYA